MGCHGRIADHDCSATPSPGHSNADLADDAGADLNVIRPVGRSNSGKVNMNRGHGQATLTRSRSVGVTVITRAKPVC